MILNVIESTKGQIYALLSLFNGIIVTETIGSIIIKQTFLHHFAPNLTSNLVVEEADTCENTHLAAATAVQGACGRTKKVPARRSTRQRAGSDSPRATRPGARDPAQNSTAQQPPPPSQQAPS